MIGSLVVALQVAAAASAVLSVRGEGLPGGALRVPLTETGAGSALAIEQLAPALPVHVERLANGRWAVHVAGTELRLRNQIPYVEAAGTIIPLASAPSVNGGRLVVPLQLVTDVLPRLAPERLRYHPARRELEVLGGAPAVVRAAAAPRRRSTPARRTPRERRRRVVVDAGHGGPDNGMTGPIGTRWKVNEKDITLAVAKELATVLRQRGVEVIMTRTTDTLIALSDRGRIANEQHGDVFISIHVNAANPAWNRPADARGFETYFLAEAKTEDAKRVEEMENASIRFETGAQAPRDDPLSFIINDMAQNEHLRESSELAELIQARLGAVEPGPSRGVKQAGFRVLVTAFMPAVLVEIGFGTNPEEARFLTSRTQQRRIARAIADATLEYLDRYERRLGKSAQ
jgi:N-acetylmuramoyl-L-alanine amidase